MPLSAKEQLQAHSNRTCRCNLLVNPRSCLYQPFLDGWDFTLEVGNATSRGEIFTPRFAVDKMIVDARILPRKVVYRYDYRGSQQTLRRYVGARVFEPAVGTGNFTATILWHKLQMAHELTGYSGNKSSGYRKSTSQLRRYQAYTLVALGSLYFNDIDPGNLQTVKWRLLRDQEIGTDANTAFWVNHLREMLTAPIPESRLRRQVRNSIKEASANWGTADRDRGILDSLYEVHTATSAPEWLRVAWKYVLDENSKIFNAVALEDDTSCALPIPGYERISWTFWRFESTATRIRAYRTEVPLARQILAGRLKELEDGLAEIPMKRDPSGAADLFTGEVPLVADGREAGERHRSLSKERQALLAAMDKQPATKQVPYLDFWKRDGALDPTEG